MAKKICAALVSLVLFLMLFPVSAAETSNSYAYWTDVTGGRRAVSSKPMYQVKTELTASKLCVGQFGELTDVCTDNDGNVYVLDGKNSRIIVLDSDYALKKEISTVTVDGVESDFKGAKGIYVNNSGLLYICDTEGQRVLVTDKKQKAVDIFTKPDSALISENFNFSPIKVADDSCGNTYILCLGSYQGTLLYNEKHDFCGFFGSNTVSLSVGETISNAFKRAFGSNERFSVSESALPFTFSDIIVDKADFVYTSTGSVEKDNQTGQIKKFNPAGNSDILNFGSKKAADEEVNDTIYIDDGIDNRLYPDIVGIAVDENGFIYCLEASYGKVFVYDKKGRNLTVFGGGMRKGWQNGTFENPSAIALNGDDIIITDRLKNTITVFSATEYGALVKQTQTMTLNGNYSEAESGWKRVLSEDANSQLAYIGLSRAAYDKENYDEALRLAESGFDRETYNLAFTEVRSQFISNHFALIFSGIFIFLGIAAALMIAANKKKPVLIKNNSLKGALSCIVHPFAEFADMKERHTGSLILSFVFIALYGVTAVLKMLCGGFLFTAYNPDSFNSLLTVVRSVGIVVLWIICSWAISSLMSGIGTLKEIAVVTGYSLIPLIIWNVLYILLSHIMIESEVGFFNLAEVIFTLIFLLMITAGTTIIHDYSFFKFLGFVVLSVFAIAVVILLLVLIGLLFSQLAGFVMTVTVELIT